MNIAMQLHVCLHAYIALTIPVAIDHLPFGACPKQTKIVPPICELSSLFSSSKCFNAPE